MHTALKFLLGAFVTLFAALSVSALTPALTTLTGATFSMGSADADISNQPPWDSGPEGLFDEYPKHSVALTAYRIGTYLVRWDEWTDVRTYAQLNGYDLSVGKGQGDGHPVTNISWHDAVKWCNALSERDGLTPVYYTTGAFTTVYRSGVVTLPSVNWTATGYRLPTEAEWEYAARGGATGKRFPAALAGTNGETLSHSQANYVSSGLPYDASGGSLPWTHPSASFGAPAPGASSAPTPGIAYTNPVDEFAPNGHGLYDMAGNIWQWCWDLYDEHYYATSPSGDPRGPSAAPTTAAMRVLRGGSWDSTAFYARVSNRAMDLPQQKLHGFRVARKAP